MKCTPNYELNMPEMGDPVRIGDLNKNTEKIDDELWKKAKIVLSENEPQKPDNNTFWFEDRGESSIDLNGSGEIVLGNGSLRKDQKFYFEEI